MKAKNKNYCRDAREEIREHGGSPMDDGLPMGFPIGDVPFGIGPPVGSSGKLSSPTDIKRSPLRGRPAALDLLWYFPLRGALWCRSACAAAPASPRRTASTAVAEGDIVHHSIVLPR